MTDLGACLPVALRGPATTITRIAAGLSGAGVYRVDANGKAFVLKVAAGDDGWPHRLHIVQTAANAGLAPHVVHVDAARRAIVSELVVDRSLPAAIMTPATRDAAIALLGRTLRRVHELPLPLDAHTRDPQQLLVELQAVLAGYPLPAFVTDAAQRVLAEPPPPRERADVLNHNDVNPSNLAYDGERLLLLDWDAAGPNDPFYDLATIAMFMRFDDATCLRLLAAYDGAPVANLPARFTYSRRLVAVLCGHAFLHLARQLGHAGTTDATALSLADFYQRLRAGEVSLATADGRWAFGLALVEQSVAL